MMRKRIIPIICLLAVTICLIAATTLIGQSGNPRSATEIMNEITLAKLVVRTNAYTPESKKYFKPDIEVVLPDIKDMAAPSASTEANAPIIVVVDELNDRKIRVIQKYFPYDNYIFRDGTNYGSDYTKAVLDKIEYARNDVKQNIQTPDTLKYFEPEIKDVLQGFLTVQTMAFSPYLDETIFVGIDWINDRKIEIFKEYFPYDYYVFEDLTNPHNVAY